MDKSEKCSVTQKGRIVIHLEDKEKRIYPDELDYYISLGYLLGWSEKHKSNTSAIRSGKEPWNKGKSISEEERIKISNSLKNYFSNNSVWNKGLTKEVDERVLLISNSMRNNLNRKGQHNSEEHNLKISIAHKGVKTGPIPKDKLYIITNKKYLTRKRNNSFNTSKPEEDYYNKLLEEYQGKEVLRQYKDKERYPFYCDFYIPSEDLFIELNRHWSHGGKPFDSEDKECLEKLALWQEKAKQSQFYQNAIYTWTVRDVEKAKVAKENNLNYKVIY